MQPEPTVQEPEDFSTALSSGRFLVTTEEPPPKGPDIAAFRRRSQRLRGIVDAVNVTESSGAVMTMSPIGVMPVLRDSGLHPILQITCRDRNRIALQADLLAAAALGVSTVSCMAGDPIDGGEDPDARGVFDLDTIGLLHAVSGLNAGHDLTGHTLKGAPSFCCGAVANPGAADLDREISRMAEKVEAGAQFFQTQALYDPAVFERFMVRAGALGVPVLAGFIVLKSAEMASRLNATLSGIDIPDTMIRELAGAEDPVAQSIAMSARILTRLRDAAQGLHVIAVGWESRLPEILEAAGISPSRDGRR